jgi:hypothetical protein
MSRSELCPQREATGSKTEKADLECHPFGGEGTGDGYPTEPESSDEEEEDGVATPPPISLPCETLPPFSDITVQQVGVTVGVHQPKRTQTRIGPGLSASLPQQPCLMSVSPNSRGTSVVPVLTKPTHLPRIS